MCTTSSFGVSKLKLIGQEEKGTYVRRVSDGEEIMIPLVDRAQISNAVTVLDRKLNAMMNVNSKLFDDDDIEFIESKGR